MNFSSLIRELRRRHVFRSAGYYILGAWLLLQVGDVIVEPSGLPGWTMRAILYFAILGFPLSVYLGWRYDFSDGTIIRTPSVSEEELDHIDLTLRSTDYLIFSVLVFAALIIAYQLLPEVTEEPQDTVTPEPAQVQGPASGTIAVLPFADISQDNNTYLGDGISDTVMHVLSQVNGLTVTSRTSAFAFRNTQQTVTEIATRLNVANVLEGSIQSQGNQVRIIARLIEAKGGTELWSGNFQRELVDIFEIQDEIAYEVVAAMKVELLPDDGERLEDRYRPKLDAYEQLILGRAMLERGTMKAFLAARNHFEKAVELDPAYAEAYVALADSYRMNTFNRAMSPPETVKIRMPLIQKALDLNPLLASAHTALGFTQRASRDMAGSTESFKRAIEINPSEASAYAGLGSNLFRQGRLQESLEAHQQAAALDPEEPQYRVYLANGYWQVAQAERAIAMIRDLIEQYPEVPSNYGMMINFLTQTGRMGEAYLYLQRGLSLDPDNPRIRQQDCEMRLGLLYTDYEQCMQRYIADVPDDLDAQFNLAMVEGRFAEAVELNKRAVRNSPFPGFTRELGIWALTHAQRWEEAIAIGKEVTPELFAAEPTVTPRNILTVTNITLAHSRSGNREAARKLAEAGLKFMSTQRALQGSVHVLGAEPAQLHAALGERELMLQTLDAAVRSGWMRYAITTIRGPHFWPYDDDPDFLRILADLEANLTEQRLWYEARKGTAL